MNLPVLELVSQSQLALTHPRFQLKSNKSTVSHLIPCYKLTVASYYIGNLGYYSTVITLILEIIKLKFYFL